MARVRSLIACFTLLAAQEGCSKSSPAASGAGASGAASSSSAGAGGAVSSSSASIGSTAISSSAGAGGAVASSTAGSGAPASSSASAGVGGATGTGGAADAGPDAPPYPTYHFQPTALPADTEVPNPMKGLYNWYGTSGSARAPVASGDFYSRFSWATLETAQGKYDFSAIDAQLAALKPGQRFSFRVMPVNSCYGNAKGIDVPGYLVAGKGWMAPSSGASSAGCVNKQVYVPDWNSSAYLAAVKALTAALGAKYDQDPRVGWVDIGLFGDWGEWHVSEFPYCDSNYNTTGALLPTQATYQAIIDAHVAAFPHKQLLMVMGGNLSVPYALSLQTPIPIGVRRDSWGDSLFPMVSQIGVETQPPSGPTAGGTCPITWTNLSQADLDTLTSRWQTAPFIAESYGGKNALQVGDTGIVTQIQSCHVSGVGNGSWSLAWASLAASDQQAFIASGVAAGYRIAVSSVDAAQTSATSMTLATTWRNDGDAPPYEPWSVTFSLFDTATSKVVAQVVSTARLKTLMPMVSYGTCATPTAATAEASTQTLTDTLPLGGVAPGTYDLRVTVSDPAAYLAPMALAVEGANADGSYSLGTVVVP